MWREREGLCILMSWWNHNWSLLPPANEQRACKHARCYRTWKWSLWETLRAKLALGGKFWRPPHPAIQIILVDMASASSPTGYNFPNHDPQTPPSMHRGAIRHLISLAKAITPTPKTNASQITVDDDNGCAALLTLKGADVLRSYDQVLNHFDMTYILQQRLKVIFEVSTSILIHYYGISC